MRRTDCTRITANLVVHSLGVSPLGYVTQLRMRLATQWIAERQLSIEQVAERLGYGSQAAFSRAFKRATGRTPGAVRSH